MKLQIEPKDGFAGVDRTYKVLASLPCFQDGQIGIEDIDDTIRAGPEHDHLTVCERSRHQEAGDQQPAVRFPGLKAAGPLHKPFQPRGIVPIVHLDRQSAIKKLARRPRWYYYSSSNRPTTTLFPKKGEPAWSLRSVDGWARKTVTRISSGDSIAF